MNDHNNSDDYWRRQKELRKKESDYNTSRLLNRSKKKEQYYKKNIQPRFLSYESIAATVSDERDNVENIIEKEDMLKALRIAMEKLTENEREIILDYFFYQGAKPSQQELAKKYGITRQAYDKRLKKVLKKLKSLIELHMSDDN